MTEEEEPDYTSPVPRFTFTGALKDQEAQLETNPLMQRFAESRRQLANASRERRGRPGDGLRQHDGDRDRDRHKRIAYGRAERAAFAGQGLGITKEPIPPLSIWNHRTRYGWHAAVWNEIDGYALGVTPIEEFVESTSPDHATDIIESMWAGLNKPFFINTDNAGAVPNMPDDAFIEVLCDASMEQVTPQAVGDAPVGLRGLWQQVLDAHELSARAAVECDRDLLYRAFLCDPLVSSLADTRAMCDELLAAEKDALPQEWFA